MVDLERDSISTQSVQKLGLFYNQVCQNRIHNPTQSPYCWDKSVGITDREYTDLKILKDLKKQTISDHAKLVPSED